MRFSIGVLLTSIGFSAGSLAAIYGANDLVPVSRSTRDEVARATAMLAPNNFLDRSGGQFRILSAPLTENTYLCLENPWARWGSLPVSCTGFLVAPDVMITAGHCMINFGEATRTRTPHCEGFSFVFDVRGDATGAFPASLPEDRIAECAEVIHVSNHSAPLPGGQIRFEPDYAVVRLKRPVRGRIPLKLALADPRLGERLTFYGHPLGAQLVRGSGKVLSLEQHYLRTNLDAFQGHSGAPVLNGRSEVVGILVRGYPESLIDGARSDCNTFNRCDEEARSCKVNDPVQIAGEHVQRIAPAARWL
jgi:hypothetical protein